MKLNNYIKIMSLGLLATAFTACENGSKDFDDFGGGTTVYFPYQTPVRTIVLGTDEYDLTLDHQHKCEIRATFGGSYNGSNGSVNVVVDKSLLDDVVFNDTKQPVKALPDNYYSLSTTTLNFDGTFYGRTVVTLTDAFFADPASAETTYVIPLRMVDQKGFGKILTGTLNPGVESASRLNAAAWAKAPQDYVLYCVKFRSKYSAHWLRRGEDKITVNGTTTTVKRQGATVEKDEKVETFTKGINGATFPVTYTVGQGENARNYSANLIFTFDANEKCTITTDTPGVTVSGNGTYTLKGAKQAWGQKDRDIMNVSYSVQFENGPKVETTDQFVWLRSGVSTEEFTPFYTK